MSGKRHACAPTGGATLFGLLMIAGCGYLFWSVQEPARQANRSEATIRTGVPLSQAFADVDPADLVCQLSVWGVPTEESDELSHQLVSFNVSGQRANPGTGAEQDLVGALEQVEQQIAAITTLSDWSATLTWSLGHDTYEFVTLQLDASGAVAAIDSDGY